MPSPMVSKAWQVTGGQTGVRKPITAIIPVQTTKPQPKPPRKRKRRRQKQSNDTLKIVKRLYRKYYEQHFALLMHGIVTDTALDENLVADKHEQRNQCLQLMQGCLEHGRWYTISPFLHIKVDNAGLHTKELTT